MKTPTLKQLTVAIIVIVLLGTAAFFGRRWYYANVYWPEQARQNDARRAEILEGYRNDSNMDGEILFVGNSITYRLNLADYFSDPRIKNRGIGLDKTADILARLDEITESKPTTIFLMIGINDLSFKVPFDTIITNYRSILNRIQQESPQTMVVIQSVLPVVAEQEKDRELNTKIVRLNESIRKLAAEAGFPYIDLHPYFAIDGSLNPALSADGIHLNDAGNRVWMQTLNGMDLVSITL